MATINISSSINMHNVNTWYGTIAAANSSEIVIVNGSLQGAYLGSFTYDQFGNVNGTLTGVTESFTGLPMFSASGLNMSAAYAAQLINSGQIQSFLQNALAGNDQFVIASGTHIIDGYGGYNTATETSSYLSSVITNNGSYFTVNSSNYHDTFYGMQGVYFTDGFYESVRNVFYANTQNSGFVAMDTTTGGSASGSPQSYTGPVAGIQHNYVTITPDSLNAATTTPNWFIHTGSGIDAIDVSKGGGTNVLDGSTGSNFLVGGGGSDTFYVDNRSATVDTWSTVVGFHSGDYATVWGVTPTSFALNKYDNLGAPGSTGLDFGFSALGRPNVNLTLAGYSSADLANGRLTVAFGTTPDLPGLPGSTYMLIHGN